MPKTIPQSSISNTHSHYRLICGMEIHAELKTKSKMFCGCKNDPFHAVKPNSYTCPVCLGMPGGLPVPNQKAIEWTVLLGLALDCKINQFSKFDRKHYFYPDLPKGYQISQYDLPFCEHGTVETSFGAVGITRIHLEEDTGKLQHKTIKGKKLSLIDFNRSGVPLVEIVSEPAIYSAAQAKEYAKKLRQVLRYLGVADCDMEQGGMRLEANISLQSPQQQERIQLPSYKVEVKNINSFKFLEMAIEYEIKRQSALLDSGQTPTQETRGWNITKQETFSQRDKETAEDYRYFPDPDIPSIRLSDEYIQKLTDQLPVLPSEKLNILTTQYQIRKDFGEILLSDTTTAQLIEQFLNQAREKKIDLSALVKFMVNKKIKLTSTKNFDGVLHDFETEHATQAIDTTELAALIAQVIAENPEETTRYQAGETKLLNFFIGQTMRKLGKKTDMALVRSAITRALA